MAITFVGVYGWTDVGSIVVQQLVPMDTMYAYFGSSGCVCLQAVWALAAGGKNADLRFGAVKTLI